jgi:hypothetical protein
MRITISILLLLTLNLNLLFGQIRKISSNEMMDIIEKSGLDSAKKYFPSFYDMPIYKIDSSLSEKIICKINIHSKYSELLLDYCSNIQDSLLSEKIYELFKAQCQVLKSFAKESNYANIKTIDDKYLFALVKQRNDSSENLLKENYQYWVQTISETQRISSIKRIVKSLHGDYLEEDCHYNCLMLALGLKKLGSRFYSDSMENNHRGKVREFQKNDSLGKYSNRYKYKEFNSITIKLAKEYDNVGEIEFESEPRLQKFFEKYPNDVKCWKTVFYNKNSGILDLGCNYAPLVGHGNRYRLELVEKNKLRIIILESWIS